MNNLNAGGAFCPQGNDGFMPLLMMMLFCPQLFGGQGENPMMLFLLMSMMQGGRMF